MQGAVPTCQPNWCGSNNEVDFTRGVIPGLDYESSKFRELDLEQRSPHAAWTVYTTKDAWASDVAPALELELHLGG